MRSSIVFLLFLFTFSIVAAQDSKFAVVFYNAENFFDWKNDPKTKDDEFTPDGERHWTFNRFTKRANATAKALIGAVGWDTPALIGLCEVENRFVLEYLLKNTALNKFPYKIIHKDSPDARGIDVSLLYNPEVFFPLNYTYFPLRNEDGSVRETREVLHVSGILAGSDTLHVFVNHWPSRYSGMLETRPLRIAAARLVRQKADSLLLRNPDAKLVIMGDFNDQPNNESIAMHLKGSDENGGLLNLSESWMSADSGTLKYQSQWYVFDQILVSRGLMEADSGMYSQPSWASIARLGFLLEADERYGGLKPFRTYVGFRYNGGFGDHLPVKLQLDIH